MLARCSRCTSYIIAAGILQRINRCRSVFVSQGITRERSSEKGSSIDAMTDWFARPVLHVSSVEASLRFYVERLGFTVAWRYEEDGRAFVAQVDRGSCALIFSDQWPEKVGKGLMFISLNVEPETHEAAVAALDALRAEFEAHGVPVKDGRWGYKLLVVEDPDGNQLFFNYPNEP
jgi:catechol 2,3-dioxygenase-like lactoylglutathione lyase family enzyme